MIIGVVSDTHIPDRANVLPQKILDEFAKVDMVIHAGDILDPDVLEKLRTVCPKVVAVRGNMDSDRIKNDLPAKVLIKIGARTIGITHGIGNPKNLPAYLENEFKKEKPDIVIFGHSHVPCNEERKGVLYFNPGSPTDTIFAPFRSYGIIEINDKVKARIVKLEEKD